MSLYQLLTVKEAASQLKLSTLTIYEYIRVGKLRAIKFGRYYRITREDLTLFINTHKTELIYVQ